MKTLGKRKIIEGHLKDANFQYIQVDVALRNFFVAKFSHGMESLIESGIYGKWEDMENLLYDLQVVINIGDGSYSKLFRMEMAGGKGAGTVSADPVALAVMKYMFELCAIIVSLAYIVGLGECVFYKKRYLAVFHNLRRFWKWLWLCSKCKESKHTYKIYKPKEFLG